MKNNAEIQRVVIFLNRQEIDFLDKIGKDALFSTGVKVSRAKFIAWLVDLAQGLQLNGDGIKNEKDFEEKFFQTIRQQLHRTSPPAIGEKYL